MNRRRLMFLVVAVALGAWPATAAAGANDVSFEAETASWNAPAGGPTSDSAAPDGSAYAVYSGGTGTKTVTTPGPSIRIAITARGDQCNGAPHMVATVDGNQVLSVDVTNTSSYSEYAADLYAPAGQHTVAVSFTNDYNLKPVCDRNLYVDSVTLDGQPFSLSSYRNAPLDPNAALDPSSANMVATLTAIAPHAGPWVNTSTYTQPVYTVPGNEPTLKVTCATCPASLQASFANVPLPSNAQVFSTSQDSDSAVIVYQPSTDKMWDFWRLQKGALGNWTAGYGGYMANVSTQTAQFADGTGGSATAIPYLMGNQRYAEVAAGVIDHAVGFAIPTDCIAPPPTFTWPALRSDGHWTNSQGSSPDCWNMTAIREGTRFRLPASLNVGALGLSPYATILAKAAQKYGMVVTDGTGVSGPVVFNAERQQQITQADGQPEPNWWASNPNGPGYNGEWPSTALAGFPWNQLQVVAVPSNPF